MFSKFFINILQLISYLTYKMLCVPIFLHGLQNMELVSSLGQTGGKLQKEYQLFKLLVTSEQIMDAINSCSGLPTEVLQWANSSFV